MRTPLTRTEIADLLDTCSASIHRNALQLDRPFLLEIIGVSHVSASEVARAERLAHGAATLRWVAERERRLGGLRPASPHREENPQRMLPGMSLISRHPAYNALIVFNVQPNRDVQSLDDLMPPPAAMTTGRRDPARRPPFRRS